MRNHYFCRIFTLTIFICVTVTGCSSIRIPFMGKSEEPSSPKAATNDISLKELEKSAYVEKGRIVDAQVIADSQNILVIPFKAGVGAVASNELDRTALMMVKGMTEAFSDESLGTPGRLRILTAEHSDEADLIMKGYISEMAEPSKIKRWLMMGSGKKLVVEGKMTDAATGQLVMVFHDRVQSSSSDTTYPSMGHTIGTRIARFILSALEESD